MGKRLFDMIFSLAALVATLPIIAVACLLIFCEDGHAPLYLGVRVGRFDTDFRMIKLRTMIRHAESFGGSSTASSDARLTRLGCAIRRYKLDELPQFINVLLGDMSIVGPRPNLRGGGVDRYTALERELLDVRPGITDLASIVFSDEGEILNDAPDPDALYETIIRPWKNRLALLYVENRSFMLDLRLIGLTLLALVSKRAALRGVDAILGEWNASAELRHVCSRSGPLPVGLPPGQIA
jgi:lipopolysaccharide/colanic/teichoic acid biosynthesis glycosyltransferase